MCLFYHKTVNPDVYVTDLHCGARRERLQMLYLLLAPAAVCVFHSRSRIGLLNSQLHERKQSLSAVPEAPSSCRVRISRLFDYSGKYLSQINSVNAWLVTGPRINYHNMGLQVKSDAGCGRGYSLQAGFNFLSFYQSLRGDIHAPVQPNNRHVHKQALKAALTCILIVFIFYIVVEIVSCQEELIKGRNVASMLFYFFFSLG